MEYGDDALVLAVDVEDPLCRPAGHADPDTIGTGGRQWSSADRWILVVQPLRERPKHVPV
ncbi:hypothetical protein GCM10023096_24340 [Nonomuraea ferruginea]